MKRVQGSVGLSLLVLLAAGVGCGANDESLGQGAAGQGAAGQGGAAGALGSSAGAAAVGPGGAAAGGEGGAADGSCATADTLPAVIESDLTVGPGCVHVNRTHVRKGATLTIEPGTTALMAPGGYLDIDPESDESALVAVGTSAQPIVFTSDAASPAPGDWQCVRIAGTGATSELRHARLEYGGAPCDASGAHYPGMLQLDSAARAVTDSAFLHSASHGALLQRNAAIGEFANDRFGANEAASVNVSASQLFVLGEGLAFDDSDDRIEVDTTYSLDGTGTVLGQPVPFRVSGSLAIGDHHGEVTLGAGARFELDDHSVEVFSANLIALGTAAAPVVFTSAAAAPEAGDWGCLFFSSPSGTPRLEHLTLEYAGSGHGCTGAEYATGVVVPGDAVIQDSTFEDIAGSAVLTSDDCGAGWCDNAFVGVAEGPLACNTHDLTSCP